MNNKDIERVQQEVHTANHIKMYQHKKAKPVELPVGIQATKLKMSHDNHLYDQQIEMIKEELKEFINERGK